VAGACAWAMLMAIVIASVTAANCDPGSDFAILSGAALALRSRGARSGMRTVLQLSPVTTLAPA